MEPNPSHKRTIAALLKDQQQQHQHQQQRSRSSRAESPPPQSVEAEEGGLREDHEGHADAARGLEALRGAAVAGRPAGKGKKYGTPPVEPNRKIVQKRLQEFGHERCFVQAPEGHLFCDVCGTPVEESSTAVKRHLGAEKHKRNAEKSARQVGRCSNIVEFVRAWGAKTGVVDSSEDMQLARKLLAVQAFLSCGLPLSNHDMLGPLLRLGGLQEADAAQVQLLAPALVEMEITRTKIDIANASQMLLIYQGTPMATPNSMLGASAILVRWCDDNFDVHERLLQLEFEDEDVRLEDQATKMIHDVLQQFNLEQRQVFAVQKDGDSTNAAIRTCLATTFRSAIELDCLTRELDNCGFEIVAPVATAFLLRLRRSLNCSGSCRRAWQEVTGFKFPEQPSGQWCSEYESWEALHRGLEFLPQFLAHPETEESDAAHSMKTMWDDPQQRTVIQLELSTIRFVMRGLVHTIRALETDKPLGFACYDILGAIKLEVEEFYPSLVYPQLQQEIRSLAEATVGAQLAAGLAVEQVVEMYTALAKRVVDGAMQRLKDSVFGKLAPQIDLYRVARLCNPLRMAELRLSMQTFHDTLNQIRPIMPDLDVAALISELPAYVQFYLDMDLSSPSEETNRIIAFWKTKRFALPEWYTFARKVFALQPSSGAAERMFSITRNTLRSDPHEGSAQDVDFYKASIMYQFHQRTTQDSV